jgi:hypothetical protein
MSKFQYVRFTAEELKKVLGGDTFKRCSHHMSHVAVFEGYNIAVIDTEMF